MAHLYENSNPEEFDSNCLVCGGKNRDAIHRPNPTKQEQHIYELCKQIVQYFDDREFHDEMERRASLETGGNVTWFEAVMGSLGTEATRLSIN